MAGCYFWLAQNSGQSFADATCFQGHLCEQGKAPKQISTPEYAFNINYGYHLDAGKFAELLKKHCIDVLGIKYISDHVTAVNSQDCGDIKSISTNNNIEILYVYQP